MRKATILYASCMAAGALSMGSWSLLSTSAFAGGNGAQHFTGHCDPSDPSCGANPILTGPPPPFVTLANCPSFLSEDDWALNFVGGKAVQHDTSNKNGDWGGGTATGPAVMTASDGVTVDYSGHATEWFGGGNNSGGQTEFGFTINFNGTGSSGNISIHANGHMTTNNGGTTTSNVTNAIVTCS